MKKLLLTLGAIASVAAPVAAVVACGSDKPVTPKTAPSKTHTAAPKVQPEDEGFTEGSLIENFDLDAESQKEIKEIKMEYKGKIYKSLDEITKDWAKDATAYALTSPTLHDNYKVEQIKVSTSGEKISVDLLDKDGKPIQRTIVVNGLREFIYGVPAKMIESACAQVNDRSAEYTKWETEHHISVEDEIKTSPLKHSIDSIIYSQAQSLTNTIDTKGDTVTFGAPSKALDVITVPAGGYTEAITHTKAGSLKQGDTITFAFDKERDLKSFTQRVGYLDAVKEMFASDTVANHAKKLGILDGTIYSYEDRDGAPDKTKAIFKLEVVAKNAVKLTFINQDQGLESDKGTNQFLMLNGFKDINGDGIITSADKGISNPFDYK